MNTITETLHALDEVKKAIQEAYASGYSNGRQRTWVGLTADEIQQVFVANSVMVDNGNAYMVAGLRAVNIGQAFEAKLKEKNT